MPFLYHGSHLGFQGTKTRKKLAPYFFLMSISYTNRIRRVFAFTKKYTKFYFMTNEPTLGGWSVGYCFAETSGLNATTRKVMESKWWFADVIEFNPHGENDASLSVTSLSLHVIVSWHVIQANKKPLDFFLFQPLYGPCTTSQVDRKPVCLCNFRHLQSQSRLARSTSVIVLFLSSIVALTLSVDPSVSVQH